MAEYSNRTDMQNKAQKIARSAARGQTYGEAGQQMASQAMVPMASGDITTPQVPAGQPQEPRPMPGMRGDLYRPTEAPLEPVTAGITQGPGIGPFEAGVPSPFSQNETTVLLQSLYQAFPNDDLGDLIDFAVNGAG
jgi:hypothetical protein